MTIGDHRTPSQLLREFDEGRHGRAEVDMRGILHAIIADVQDSYTKAMQSHGASLVTAKAVTAEVTDYIANHYGDDAPTEDMEISDKDHAALIKMATQAVRDHGIDGDNINSDTIDDDVFPDVFGEAVNAEQFTNYAAAAISDVLHEGIALTYWAMVDETNGVDINPTGFDGDDNIGMMPPKV